MSTKLDPGAYDCYAKAEPDEPYFMLLARDPHAAVLVNLWAAMRRLNKNPDDADKIAEAEKCANQMVSYFMEKKTEIPGGITAVARGVAVLAELVGAVVTIEQHPLKPLAMGHYTHTIAVREKRPAA